MATVMLVGLVAACGDDGGETPAEPQGGDAAADFPSKRVEFVVPFAPGGGTDLLAREYGDALAEALGGDVSYQNVEGAGGAVGADRVVQSEPDGHTVGMPTGVALTVGPLTNDDLSFATPEDYTVFGKLPIHPMVIVTSADAPWESLSDLVAAAEETPGEISIAVSGTYSTPGLAAYAIEQEGGVEFNVVPFTGGGADARTALVAGEVDAAIAGGAVYKGFVDANELKVLGVFHDEPYPLYPDAPLSMDEGIDWQAASDFFLIGPPGVPADIQERISTAAEEAVNNEDFASFAEESGYVIEWTGPEESIEILDEYTSDMTELVQYVQSRQ